MDMLKPNLDATSWFHMQSAMRVALLAIALPDSHFSGQVVTMRKRRYKS